MIARFCYAIFTAMAAASIALGQAAVSNSTTPADRNPAQTGPAASPALPSVEEVDQMFKESPLGKAADEARLHAQWRDLSNRTINDSELIAARRWAEAASTDLEKRKRLQSYYTMYFDRMLAKASSPELKEFVQARRMEHLGLLAQPHVRPDASLPSATPSVSPKQKHPKIAAPEPPLPR
jgi:hypothetical protein